MARLVLLHCLLVLAIASLHAGWVSAESPDPISAAGPAIAIVPEPRQMQHCRGEFDIDAEDSIAADPSFADSRTFLRERVEASTGIVLGIAASANQARIRVNRVALSDIAREGYVIEVTPDFVTIRAADADGAFYGVQTLLQLMPTSIYGTTTAPSLKLPCVKIEDSPRFEWRGFMLDVSRHFFNVNRVKQIIEQMAMHKLNRLHLHLTDDPGWRVEIPGFPQLTEVGAIGNISDPQAAARYFTASDIEEIVRHATRHHITVIPEIDMPGHGGAAARAYPEHFDGNLTWNIGSPEAVEFAKAVLDEVIAMFPGPYIHFGGDELRNHSLEALPEVQQAMRTHGYSSIQELEALFDRTIADHLLKQGRTPIAWDEVSSFGLDERTIVQWWRAHKPETKREAVAAGHRIIVSPTDHLYFDYSQAPGEPGAPWEGNDNGPNSLELVYLWEPVPDDFSSRERELFMGVEAALWTEFIQTERYLEFMMFPRMAALAEVAWTPRGSRTDFERFKEKLEVQFSRYEALGVNYRKPSDWYPVAENAAEYLRN